MASFALAITTNTALYAQQQTVEAPAGMTMELMNTFNGAQMDMQSGKTDQAIEKLKTVVKALPTFYAAHQNLGSALALRGRNAEALEELKKADALHPNDEMVLANIGQLYQLNGQNAEALASYKKYLASFPKGQYAARMGMMIKTLQFEVDRMKGVSSTGQDNYLNEAIAGGGGRWAKMPVNVYIKPGEGVPGYKPEYTVILKNAFKQWADASGGKVQVNFTDALQNNGINCQWSANIKDVVNPQEGGQALVLQDPSKHIMRVEMVILTQHPMMTNGISDTYMRHVCLHEVGHSLGIGGHSSGPDDLMFAAANYEAARGIMSERDRKTIALLYGGDAGQPVNKEAGAAAN